MEDSRTSLKRKLCEDVSFLYLNEELSDVTLNVQGEKLCAHKTILAARNGYFRNMFFGNFIEQHQSEVSVEVSSSEVFKILLKYLYTVKVPGTVSLPSTEAEFLLDVLTQSHRFCIADLSAAVISELKQVTDLSDIPVIVNTAKLYDFTDLKNHFFELLDNKASEFLQSEHFRALTQESLIELFRRRTFDVPEVEKFKAITEWVRSNGCSNDTSWILSCIKMGLIPLVDIVTFVRPTALVSDKILLDTIARDLGIQHDGDGRNENYVAASYKNADVLSLKESQILNKNMISRDSYESHAIGDNRGIVIKLDKLSLVNHITLHLWKCNNTSTYQYNTNPSPQLTAYSYYIEVSSDFINWRKIIDYSRFVCRAEQNLYFEEEVVLYIRVVGTAGDNNYFRMSYFEAEYATNCPELVQDIVRPNRSVRESTVYNHTSRTLTSAQEAIAQWNQPYIMSSVLLSLQHCRNIHIFDIETSNDGFNWEMAAHFREEAADFDTKIVFSERTVIFVRIIGTFVDRTRGEFWLKSLKFSDDSVNSN